MNSVEEYTDKVPIRDYEEINKYIDEIKKGSKDVLWPGKPKYLAKTSGLQVGEGTYQSQMSLYLTIYYHQEKCSSFLHLKAEIQAF